MNRGALALAGAVLLLAGCSGSPGEPPSGAGSSPESAATTRAEPSTSPAPSVPVTPGAGESGAPCPPGQPSGTYRLTEFAAQASSGLGHGKGGDVTVTFTDGRYRMVAKGGEPVAVEIADKAAGALYVDGTITGTVDPTGAVRGFAVDSAEGTAYVTNAEGRAEIDFGQLTKIIGLDGRLAVACQGDRLSLAGEAAVFSLAKV